ncbi:fumarylacetoacetate hydrolase family protein [Maritimibacter sp. UBA3975]|uniref:2-keto-4-pentenoate hydratase n=1 Tax=Maritimibacter sp. UBA3975 TaxID=1946833 RepID=UPI000C0B199E|nr:fumarylacetoacetate hydrolase family protein [Maritimibacter sp. UBA3975]MAM62226.1 2-keto-4-pentenoate hydratase [Maritimibacter sp.]
MSDKTQEAASRIWEATRSGKTVDPVRDLIGETDLDAAYQVQDYLTEKRLREGGRIVGRKIGLTSRSVQVQLGVDQPDFGILFSDMDVPTGGEIPWRDVMQPKVEAEIAFVMKRSLTGVDVTTAEVMRAVEYVVPAIEVVGSRIRDWDIRITDTIADNASSSHYVLGHTPRRLRDVDILDCGMHLQVNCADVATGLGRACLGSPLNATTWLARRMAQVGRPLAEGDVVLAGALGPMAPVKQGDFASATIEGLGTVSVGFSKE